jgi:PST family polysaccharide transporter
MLIHKAKQLLLNRFIRNVGWLGGAELVNRIFRLGTTVTLARMFSPQEYGLMAIIYATADFATTFTLRDGIGAKIVQADKQDIKTICDTSYWLNWILCGFVFVIQCIAAFPIARCYGNSQLVLPICTIALIYLIFPVFMVQSALIERENRLKITAFCHATQSIFANIITIIFVFLGTGVWAIVWAMVLSTPVWIVITWINHPWRPPKSFQLERWHEIANFGKNVLGFELLTKLRLNLDYLLVGTFLGVRELGIYYFAFNAGSGITKNVVNIFMSALYPYICAVRENYQEFKKRYLSSIRIVVLIIVPIVILQSSLAPLYVPIIFGEKWTLAIPILIIICLSVIPYTFKRAFSLPLQATDKTHIILRLDIAYTIIFAASLLVVARWGVLWVATTVLVVDLLLSFIFVFLATKYSFGNNLFSTFFKRH